MIQLMMTQKVQKELGLRSAEISLLEKNDTVLGDWVVNMFFIERRKALIFVNTTTLFSFTMIGFNKSSTNNIYEIFLKGLSQILSFEGIENSKIDSLLSSFKGFRYTKTDNKKVLGNLNNIIFMFKQMVAYNGGLKECDLTDITMSINRTPAKNIGWAYPIEAVNEILRDPGGHA